MGPRPRGLALPAGSCAREALASWNDGSARQAIERFVRGVTTPGPDFVPAEERIAVFDNDGRLWVERTAPISLDDKEAKPSNIGVGTLDKALDEAARFGWTVVSMKRDWRTVFPGPPVTAPSPP